MIPTYEIDITIELPSSENCGYPTSSEITEEGFGCFRGTWFLGRTTLTETREVMRAERDLVALLDELSPDAATFELLASHIEQGPDESVDIPSGSLGRLARFARSEEDEAGPLGDLEVGVAGLSYALSTVGFLTAASCRAHSGARSWSDCPVVLFGAHRWRALVLAHLAENAGCGMGQDRGMLTVFSDSVVNLMALADDVVAQRNLFRRSSGGVRRRGSATAKPVQPQFPFDEGV
jgi:hypothetical protein